jgi:hypothetical protein
MQLASVFSPSSLGSSSTANELINWIKRPFTRFEILAGLCVAGGIATNLYRKRNIKSVTIHKDESGKTLDDYSFRDLFHFFINPEFHIDKLHLAKG